MYDFQKLKHQIPTLLIFHKMEQMVSIHVWFWRPFLIGASCYGMTHYSECYLVSYYAAYYWMANCP